MTYPMTRIARRDGLAHGLRWEGPNGDGSFGSLSLDFIEGIAASYGEEGSPVYMRAFFFGRRKAREAAIAAYLD